MPWDKKLRPAHNCRLPNPLRGDRPPRFLAGSVWWCWWCEAVWELNRFEDGTTSVWRRTKEGKR